MSFVLFDELGHIVLILYKLASFVESVALERLNLRITQRDTLGSEQLVQHVVPNLAIALRVHDTESCEQVLSWRRLELVNHQDIDHERFHLFSLDELRWLIILKFDQDIVTNLGLGWELQQVSHQVRDLSLIEVALLVTIDDLECITNDLEVELLLAGLLCWVLRCGQHFSI